MKTKIQLLCKQQGITTGYELAKKSGLKQPTAYRAFDDDIKQFTPETLKILCDTLDCTPNDIFGYESKPNAPANAPQIPAVAFETGASKTGKVFTNYSTQSLQNASDNEAIENKEWLDSADAGKILNINPRTVREHAEKGKLLGEQNPTTKKWRFSLDAVTKFKRTRGNG